MQKKRKNYENTYKLEPDEKPELKVLRQTMEEVINGKYQILINGFERGFLNFNH